MTDARDRVTVLLDDEGIAPRSAVGTLTRERAAGKSVISFSYEPDWVAAASAFPIDPQLPLYEGEQYFETLPGIFSDIAPDRWGRTLLERREALAARHGGRAPRELDEWDCLIGVADVTRMGALRIAPSLDAAFIDSGPLTIPPVTQLRELEHLAAESESGAPVERGDEERWISMLVAPGSSLGGARPKASFLEADGALWIAKFPSREDRYDVGAWEYVLSHLAREAGLDVPSTRIMKLGSDFHAFCSRRFDRTTHGRRLYASAMTLTGLRDNEDASYLDIAQAIADLGDPGEIEADLHQLFRRVAFNVLAANRDDHLRNHGFLRAPKGWRLAPAFDMNPSPAKHEHVLALDERLRAPDTDLLVDTAPFYRLPTDAASEIVEEVREVVTRWKAVASRLGLPHHEIERMAGALPSE